MKRQIKFGIIILVLSIFGIYFLIIPFDYVVKFETSQPPLAVYNMAIEKEIKNVSIKGNKISYVEKNKDFPNLELKWSIFSNEKNKTNVNVYIYFTSNKNAEKTKILFGKSKMVKDVIHYVTEFRKELSLDLKKISWGDIQEGSINSSQSVCVSVSCKIKEKANNMNKYIDALATYLSNGEKSPPRLYIHKIDVLAQTIDFDFCFPVRDSINTNQIQEPFFIKKYEKIDAHEFEFYGNYSLTHKGWFKIIQQLNLKGEEIEYPIVEIFFDSPFSMEDDAKWLSKTYFQINKKRISKK